MTKFGVYHGKDQAFRKRYASGGSLVADDGQGNTMYSPMKKGETMSDDGQGNRMYTPPNYKPSGHWSPKGWVIGPNPSVQTN